MTLSGRFVGHSEMTEASAWLARFAIAVDKSLGLYRERSGR
jgi:hypothetical protein